MADVYCKAHFNGSILKVVGMDVSQRGEDTVWSFQMKTTDPIVLANAMDTIVVSFGEGDYFSDDVHQFAFGRLNYVLSRMGGSAMCSLSLNNSRILFSCLPVGYLKYISLAVCQAMDEFYGRE